MKRTYADKRNFAVTPEPTFATQVDDKGGPLTFVIQRHEASHLHFDFRLECDGALKSWAVPKGPSLDPTVKRAAIMVEDHPLDYADFEGRIPKGQYGGGEVILWDEGTYEPEGATGDRRRDEELVKRGLSEGKLSFTLYGSRLQGAFTLIRKGESENWLLIKRRDEFASTEDPTKIVSSVRTGRTAEDLRAGKRGQQMVRIPGAILAPIPPRLGVMVPKELPKPFTSELWTFEPKLDGIRALAIKDGPQVRIISRNGNEVSSRFPGVVSDLRALPHASFVLDGELVLLDQNGRPSFQSLMEAYHRGQAPADALHYYAFDLIYLDGYDLRRVSLSDRRAQLERVPLTRSLRLLETVDTDGEMLYDEAMRLGFEGIVGKRLDSKYREGAPSDDWVKIKGYHTEEFLICGFTMGFGSREHTFGALLLGRRDESGKLRFCGSVGGGLSEAQLIELKRLLEPLKVKNSPFDEPISTRGVPTFVRPELLAEVRFMSWTKDRRLRFPIFKRLRPDLQLGTAEPAPKPELATTGASESDAVLEALLEPGEELQLTIDGNPIRFTSLSKELWPGITKRDFVRYLASVSDIYLAHLRDRPVTFVRYPDGIGGEGFFQRHWEHRLPEFVETAKIFSQNNGKALDFVLCNNLASLLWFGQVAAIELHPWHSRVTTSPDAVGLGAQFDTLENLEESVLEYPDYLVCDLDPNIRSGLEKEGAEPELNEAGWRRTVEVAFGLKEMLDSLRLKSFVKTTGKTGLHVYLPLERHYDSTQVREVARTLGQHLMERMPGKITMEIRLNKRPNLVFFDANMNGRGKTLASAYSPRPVPGGRVSMPIAWEMLDQVHPDEFNIFTVPKLLATNGDEWHGILNARQLLAVGP
ncbi:non-homologous end-joining DNA ligase [Fimbriimonas ginsengisoli]|uniref:DNA ligase (ATP) n=1 Tax=Fimbriimonas ginsengisoli Gsoil 348 TaxID=661478 RepID=A0A068NNM3_FIMGI|nr:non-homologous end-joining DNA ligase [Fimbriimonas ginsengisoli]AIE85002.1 DNA ligase D [Fimbriimonas ginsengisoli Gsoil 348]